MRAAGQLALVEATDLVAEGRVVEVNTAVSVRGQRATGSGVGNGERQASAGEDGTCDSPVGQQMSEEVAAKPILRSGVDVVGVEVVANVVVGIAVHVLVHVERVLRVRN